MVQTADKDARDSCCSGLGALKTLLLLHDAPKPKKAGNAYGLKEVITYRDEDALKKYVQKIPVGKNSPGDVTPSLLDALSAAVKQGDVNALSSTETIALHEAVRGGFPHVVTHLLQAEASVDSVDGQGQTALDVAQSRGTRKNILNMLRKTRDIQHMREFNNDLEWIPNVKLFEGLQPSEYPRLAAAFILKRYERGETIVREGERGHELFLIQSGSAKVLQANVEQATLGPGAHFGEVALLTDAPRNATVVAAEELSAKTLDRAVFESLELKRKLRARKAVRQGDELARFRQNLRPKTKPESELIRGAMRSNLHLGPLLKDVKPGDEDAIIAQACGEDVAAGQTVVTQGELRADLFYVVQEGTFDVVKDGEVVLHLQPGMSFGELALLYRAPRAASVVATSRGKLWTVGRQELRTVMQAPLRKKLERWASLLEAVAILKDVPADGKRTLADALVETTFYECEHIIRQGEVGDTFYILQEGEVVVDVNGREVSRLAGDEIDGNASPTSGLPRGFFGERALLQDEPRAASVKVLSKKAVVLALHRGIFTQVVKGAREPMERENTMITYSKDKLVELGVLGFGGFGVVSLVRCSLTNRTFALKAISKGHVLQQCQEKSIMNEKHILRMTSSPFLVRMAATFNGSSHLYFLLEPALGGELFTIYQRKKHFFGSQRHARFYSACMTLAFEHLHERQVVYRDLKPENVLLDVNGYAKVTDFGLAKFVVGHTYTTCGTPDYFAPEMVMSCGHTLAVDWWTLGVFAYELMSSDAPFSAHEPMAIMRKVKRGIEYAKFPNKKASWAQFVISLCRQQPSERLPMRRGGTKNIKEHPWFTEISFMWDDLEARKMTPAYLPDVKNESDMCNFDKFGPNEGPPQIPYKDPGTQWDRDFEDRCGPRLD